MFGAGFLIFRLLSQPAFPNQRTFPRFNVHAENLALAKVKLVDFKT